MAGKENTGFALVTRMVQRGIERCDRERDRAHAREPRTLEERARQHERVAELFEREARWWDVLIGPTYRWENGIPSVYGAALFRARHDARQYAQQYRELAESARRRATLAGSAVAA